MAHSTTLWFRLEGRLTTFQMGPISSYLKHSHLMFIIISLESHCIILLLWCLQPGFIFRFQSLFYCILIDQDDLMY